MMGVLKTLLPALFVIGTVTGCSDVKYSDDINTDPSSTPDIPTFNPNMNSVSITSVSPSEAVAGVATDFTVVGTYNLATVNDGILDIGFNTQAASEVLLLSDLAQPVTQGSGVFTFHAQGIVPVSWSTNDFAVTVYLSENPKANPWMPLYTLSLKIPITAKKAAKASPVDSTYTASGTSSEVCYHSEGVDVFCVNYDK